MTTMQHATYDYNTASLKRAIQHGSAKPTPRGNGTMTIFPLGLPQGTRDRLAHLSFMTGESQAEIIRQAIDKILDEGVCGVEQVTGKRALMIATRRASLAQEKANRAAARAQERELAFQEKAAVAAQRAAQKAEKTEVVPVPTQPESPPTDQPLPNKTGARQLDQAVTDNLPGGAGSLDRPAPPSPVHTWVRGNNNRWGGYWRAPKGTRTV